MRHHFWLLALLLLSAGCRGEFVIQQVDGAECETSPDCGVGRFCNSKFRCADEATRCSADAPRGDCPIGSTCNSGTCVCIGEACRVCSPENPDGECLTGSVCVDGSCVFIDNSNACSPERPEGLCRAGSFCRQGECTRITCSAEEPAGVCPADQRCINGVCEYEPCGEDHPDGVCDTGFFCASNFQCLADGRCAGPEDCESFELCSIPDDSTADVSVCVSRFTCRFDTDCLSVEGAGPGFECDAGACVPRIVCSEAASCPPEQFCSSESICRRPGQCDSNPDCSEGTYCSVQRVCIPDGQCRENGDCGVANQVCSKVSDAPRCIDVGTCIGDEDCGPGEGCNVETSVCELTGASCDSNALALSAAGNLSCPAGAACCGAEQICSGASSGSGICIGLGACRGSGDCPDGFSCDDGKCLGSNDRCLTRDQCGAGELCSVRGACIPAGTCAVSDDCGLNERCSGEFRCIPAPGQFCGATGFGVGERIPPNLLFVVDRSRSMQLCGDGDPFDGSCGQPGDDGNCCSNSSESGEGPCVEASCASSEPGKHQDTCVGTCSGSDVQCVNDSQCSPNQRCLNRAPQELTRWEETRAAINQTVALSRDQANFGLARYPRDPEEDDVCYLACNAHSCSATQGNGAGVVDVPVGPEASEENDAGLTPIEEMLADSFPGGGTPTAATLRSILERPDLGGLNAADRANAIILLTDGQANGDEEGIRSCTPDCSGGRCGGLCPPCNVGGACETDLDCVGDAICPDGTCRPDACFTLTAACGGECPACDDGEPCTADEDCRSQLCGPDGLCLAPTCVDGEKNGDETGVDCGGGCSNKCATGRACTGDNDCQSGVCQERICRPDSCAETCGGSCGPCPPEATCRDGVRNNGETDIDCGGPCAPCTDGFACFSDADCQSGTCTECDKFDDEGCKVNATLDRLYAEDNRIRTFVVGFSFSPSSAFNNELNCYAAHGRTARNLCDQASTENCESFTASEQGRNACYFTANDTQSLAAAFEDVVTEVSSCTYDVGSTSLLAEPSRSQVYLNFGTDSQIELLRIKRQDWTFRAQSNTIEFFGDACSILQNQGATPYVVFGCLDQGG